MMTHLDISVGSIVHSLGRRNMLNDSIIVFTTDNGGPAEGFNLNAASNWPLRGVKNTLWEGGVRGAAFLFSPKLSKINRVSTQNMHIVDWLPTLLHAAGGSTEYYFQFIFFYLFIYWFIFFFFFCISILLTKLTRYVLDT